MKEKEKITKEEKKKIRQAQKEEKKAIRRAEKEMRRVGRKMAASTGINAFSESGLFQRTDGSWVRFYVQTRSDRYQSEDFLSVLDTFNGEYGFVSRFYRKNHKDSRLYVNLTVHADHALLAEELLQELVLRIDECGLHLISVPADEFLAAAFSADLKKVRHAIKKKKDLTRELLPEYKEYEHFLLDGDDYIAVFQLYMTPEKGIGNIYPDLYELGNRIDFLYRYVPASTMEHMDYQRMLERKYNRLQEGLPLKQYELASTFAIHCDSPDAAELIRDTVQSLANKCGFLCTTAFAEKRRLGDCLSTLGLIDYKVTQMISADVMKSILAEKQMENNDVKDEV